MADFVPITITNDNPKGKPSFAYHGIKSRCPCPPAMLQVSKIATNANRNSIVNARRNIYGGMDRSAASYYSRPCTIEDTILRNMEDLLRFLRIPSISADPAFAGEVRRAAEFV